MSESLEAGPSGWLCPRCNRDVPKRSVSCYCGYRRSWGEAKANRATERLSVSGSRWAAAVLMVLALGVGVVMVAQRPAPAAPTPRKAVASELVAEPPGDATPRVEKMESPSPEAPPELIVGAPPPTAGGLRAPDPVALLDLTPPADAPASPRPPVFASDRPLDDVVADVLPAVVSVETDRGHGSGFFAALGEVITSLHVVRGSSRLAVKLASGQTFPASLTSIDEKTDLALLEVQGATQYSVLQLGSARDARPGQEVVAVGSALGLLESTVTRGIVSAVRTDGGLTLLQTDAAINPGNSGGPILNRSGQVIGVATLKISPAESIGFAVGAEHAASLLRGGGTKPDATPAPSSQPPRATDRDTVREPRRKSSQTASRRAAVDATPSPSPRDEAPPPQTTMPRDPADEATKRFEAAMKGISFQGIRLKLVMERLERSCIGRSWESRSGKWTGPLMSSDDGRQRCNQSNNDVSREFDRIQRTIREAEETAYRRGVSPGVTQQIRRRYGLLW